MKNNIRLKIRDLSRRGGRRVTADFKMEPPAVSATSPSDQLAGNIAAQRAQDAELTDMNNKLSGGGTVAPQMGQAGDAGNNAIAGGLQSGLQADADGKFDTPMDPNKVENAKSTVGGRRRKIKTKRRRKKKKRKTKRKRKSRRKSRRKRRKSKRKRRR